MGAGQPLCVCDAIVTVEGIVLIDPWRARYHATAAGRAVWGGAEDITFVASNDAWRLGDQVTISVSPMTLNMVAGEWGMDPPPPTTIV